MQEGKSDHRLLPFYHIYGRLWPMINGLSGPEIVLFTGDFDDIIYSIDSRRAPMLSGATF